jgi:hypothetical protein
MGWIIAIIVVAVFLLLLLPSLRRVGPTQVGLVQKRFGFKELSDDNPVAFKHEPGCGHRSAGHGRHRDDL